MTRENQAKSQQLRSAIVHDALRDEINDGILAPGERLATRAIATRFGVSDIPVREALWMLEREGLVETVPYAGARVRQFDAREIREASEVRGHLEALAIAQSAGRLSIQQTTRVEGLLSDLAQALDQADFVAFGRLNRTFHQLLIAGCPNRYMISLIEKIWDDHRAYQAVFQLHPERARESQDEHVQLARAVLEGDGQHASRLIVIHRHHAAIALAGDAGA